MGKAVLKPIAEQKAGYKTLIDALILDAINSIENGKITVNNVDDLERLIKLDTLLIGTPVDIKAEVTVIDFPEEIRELIDVKIKELEERNYP